MAFNNAINANESGVQFLDPTGVWNGVDGGTAGNVLTSNGTNTEPSFQAPGSASITITADSGGAQTSDAFTLTGDGSIAVTGATDEFTFELTGLIDHAIQVGAGTSTLTQLVTTSVAGQVLQSGGPTDNPAYSTAAYPLTTSGNEFLYSPTDNLVIGFPTSGNGLLITDPSGVPSFLAAGNSGQILFATDGEPPSWQDIPAGGITTIDGDSGSITGSTVTIDAGNGNNVSGSTVSFINSGTVGRLHLSDASNNTILGASAGNGAITSADSTGFGVGALSSIGGFGGHTAVGRAALQSLGNGQNNCAFGYNALSALDNGSYNIAIGYQAGSSYTTSESNNILIGNAGEGSEANVMRLGTQGSGSGQTLYTFVAGIVNIDSTGFADPKPVFVDLDTGQLGVSLASPTISITGDSGGSLVSSAFTLTGGSTGFDFEGSGSTLTLLGDLNVDSGGTGNTTFPAHSILVGNGTDAITSVGPTGNQYQVLMSGGSVADPLFSAAVYPWTISGSQILYASSDNTIDGLTPANNGVMIASNTGVPSFLSAGTTGQVLTATTGAPASWQDAAAPVVPAFSAYVSTDIVNTTGNGTPYVCVYDEDILNIGTCYNTTTGEFTAPVDGNYLFNYGAYISTSSTFAAGNVRNYLLVNSNINYVTFSYFISSQIGVGSSSVIIPLESGDTVAVVYQATALVSALNTTILGNANNYNFFSGSLV